MEKQSVQFVQENFTDNGKIIWGDLTMTEKIKKLFEEVEREYLYNSMEFLRLGYTDLRDRQECEFHRISYTSHKKNTCPMCMMRKKLGITTKKKLGTKEYADRLYADGYEADWIRKYILKSFKGDKKQ